MHASDAGMCLMLTQENTLPCLCETRVGMTSLSSQARGRVRQIARCTGENKITLSTSPLSTPPAPHISNGGAIRDRILAYGPSVQPLNLYAVPPQYPSLTEPRSLTKCVSLSSLSHTFIVEFLSPHQSQPQMASPRTLFGLHSPIQMVHMMHITYKSQLNALLNVCQKTQTCFHGTNLLNAILRKN